MGVLRRTGTIVLVALIALSMTACAAKRDSALKDADKITEATEQGEFSQTLSEAQTHWEKRGNKNDLRKSIELMESAVKMPASDMSEEDRKAKIAETYERLSRAYYLMADSHIRLEATEEGEKDDEMMSVFEKGVTAAEKALAIRAPEFAKLVAEKPNKWQEAVVDCDTSAIPALYWYATNLGKWALLEGIATILARKDDIKVTMDWIMEQNDEFFYGAPYRYFGVYHTKVPIGGGAPPKSKAAFEKSLEIAPGYLATRVLMANSYAVLVGDRELFDELLNEVVNADPNAVPDIAPENRLEQQKAKRLLAKGDDLFY
jgi:tetratricopeptide (TPR) repeat protein